MRADGGLYTGFKLGRGNRFAYSRISPRLLPMGDNAGESLIAGMTYLNDYTPTFTRASSAFDPYNLTTVSTNVRRRRPFNVAGRTYWLDLIEGSRTNLILQSQTLATTWTPTNTSISSDSLAAPDGTTTADKIVENTATNAHNIAQNISKAGSAITYSASVYIKAGERTKARLFLLNGASSAGVALDIDLVAGTAVQNAAAVTLGAWVYGTCGIEASNNGWYRVWIVATSDTNVTARIDFRLRDGTGSASYTGDGTSGLYAWGFQLEAMAAGATTGFPSSYIATTTASVTRSADKLSCPYVLGQMGTLIAACVPNGWTGDQDGTTAFYLFSDDVAGGGNHASRFNSTISGLAMVDAGGTESAQLGTMGYASGSLMQPAGAWDSTAIRGYRNGVLGTQDTTLTPPYTTGTTFTIGTAATGNTPFYGWIGVFASASASTAANLLSISRASRLGS